MFNNYKKYTAKQYEKVFPACIITKDMKNLIDSLYSLGYDIAVYSGVQTYTDSRGKYGRPFRNYLRAVTDVTIYDLSDCDGNCYELSFEWDGTPITNYEFNTEYCKWADEI